MKRTRLQATLGLVWQRMARLEATVQELPDRHEDYGTMEDQITEAALILENVWADALQLDKELKSDEQ